MVVWHILKARGKANNNPVSINYQLGSQAQPIKSKNVNTGHAVYYMIVK